MDVGRSQSDNPDSSKKNPGSRVPLCSLSVSIFSFSLSSIKQWLSGKEPACNAGDVGSIPGSGDPLEKEMATHSSILAWRILWTEEPGGGATVHGVAEELDMTEWLNNYKAVINQTVSHRNFILNLHQSKLSYSYKIPPEKMLTRL